MGRDNPALIGVFLEITPDVGDLFQLIDIWGGNYPSDPDTIRTLADRGLDLHRANWIGRTFLHGCVRKRAMLRRLRVFLELGADIEAVELEYGGDAVGCCGAQGAGGDGEVSIGTRCRSSRASRVALGAARFNWAKKEGQ